MPQSLSLHVAKTIAIETLGTAVGQLLEAADWHLHASVPEVSEATLALEAAELIGYIRSALESADEHDVRCLQRALAEARLARE
jgi:hypothetical protein